VHVMNRGSKSGNKGPNREKIWPTKKRDTYWEESEQQLDAQGGGNPAEKKLLKGRPRDSNPQEEKNIQDIRVRLTQGRFRAPRVGDLDDTISRENRSGRKEGLPHTKEKRPSKPECKKMKKARYH